ncbi:MAG: aminoacyltransferase [Firmicutes bacterium]|nr:aminoacyltransferase [Bacillota bacterium]
MKLINIDEKTYLNYALNQQYISIYQLPQWGELKKENGWITHLLGLYDDKELIGVTLILEKRTLIKKSLFYAPRGFLLDFNNQELLQEFVNLLKIYIKEHKGFLLKVDPNVILKIYDSNGNELENVGENILINMKKIGFKHLGFTKNFETLQPRYICRFKLRETYEKTLESFSKSTRKNIAKVEKNGVHTRKIDVNEIDLFVSLLEETSNDKKFILRPTWYYKKMYELMKDYINLYITYLDTEEYYCYILNEIEKSKKELLNLEKQIQSINVGNKIKNRLEEIKQKINNLKNKLQEADNLRKSYQKINIGALMSIFIKEEGITFMSGTSSSYKNFNPKYAFYNEHIKECLKQNKKYCNFYGISGDINPNNPYYSIYEIKKGFNPEIIELLGEFDLVIKRFDYYLYKIALKIYKILK